MSPPTAPTVTSSEMCPPSTPSLLLNSGALPFIPMPSRSSSVVISCPTVTCSSTSTLPTTSLTPSITFPITSPLSQPTSSISSYSSPQSLCPQPVSVEPTKQKKQTKPSKTKPTLATSPEDFEKENLKVERDFARLKVRELDQELKSQTESLEILTARCRLLEDDRNRSASSSLNSNKDSDCPAQPPPIPPVSSQSSPLESLINLEVIRAIKEHSRPDMSVHATSILSKLEVITEKLEIIFENEKFLNDKLGNIQVALNDVHNMCSVSVPQSSPPQVPPPKATPAPSAPSLSPTRHITQPRSFPHTSVFKPRLLHPNQKSCLGPPPRFERRKGVHLPLSKEFLRTHACSPENGRQESKGASNREKWPKPSTRPPPPPKKSLSVPLPPASHPSKPPSRSVKFRTKIYERNPTVTTTAAPSEPPITLIDITDECSSVPDAVTSQIDETLSLLDNDFLTDVFGDPKPGEEPENRIGSENRNLITLN